MRLVSSAAEAVARIKEFALAVNDHSALSDRLGQGHAFYVLDEDSADPLFGFSKFVGYADVTPETYEKKYKELDGRNTEWALRKWFMEIPNGTSAYTELHTKLSALLAKFGKRPREGAAQKVRFMTLKPEFRDTKTTDGDDQALLNLLIAVASKLPSSQRSLLRASL